MLNFYNSHSKVIVLAPQMATHASKVLSENKSSVGESLFGFRSSRSK